MWQLVRISALHLHLGCFRVVGSAPAHWCGTFARRRERAPAVAQNAPVAGWHACARPSCGCLLWLWLVLAETGVAEFRRPLVGPGPPLSLGRCWVGCARACGSLAARYMVVLWATDDRRPSLQPTAWAAGLLCGSNKLCHRAE